jgi:hypothetical protein
MFIAGYFFLSLKPDNGFHSFPTTFQNHLDKKPMKVEIERMSVELLDAGKQLSREMQITNIFYFSLILFVIVAMIFFPILTFRIIRSITVNKIFDPSNIRKLRVIGYALLAYYFAGLIFSFLHYRMAASVVQVDGYSLQIDWGNSPLVVLGLVVLMFAELLQISVQLKEEQALTV